MNVECCLTGCDHNTGFTKECMYGVTDELIDYVKSGKPMCEDLRDKILELCKEEIGNDTE